MNSEKFSRRGIFIVMVLGSVITSVVSTIMSTALLHLTFHAFDAFSAFCRVSAFRRKLRPQIHGSPNYYIKTV